MIIKQLKPEEYSVDRKKALKELGIKLSDIKSEVKDMNSADKKKVAAEAVEFVKSKGIVPQDLRKVFSCAYHLCPRAKEVKK
jgi:hypothetical protein